ncbi:hypothetical protein [Lancefieldella rimae]|uniref:hypothetical protein n=1 Tax=Lancefieldella rimae TaxID=1383 RepID=UPI001CAF3F4C|nr:hypothetical protein [Lancefieldella rimae]MBF4803986.1 hypothetical protein [Lancefieldella rimae]
MKKIWKTPAILTNAILLVLIALCSIVFIVTKPEVQPENVFLLMMYAISSAMLWFSALALISLLISNFTSIQLSYVTKIVFRVLAGIVFGLMVFSPVIFSIPIHLFKVIVSLLLVVAIMMPMAIGVFGFLYGLSWAQTKMQIRVGEKGSKDEDLLADSSSHPKTSQRASSKANESSLPGNYHETLSKDADINKDK